MLRRRGGWVLAGLLVVIVPVTAALVLGGSGELDAPSTGLGDSGAGVRWGLPAVRGVLDVAIALTTGLLVLAAVVLPGPSGGTAPTASNAGENGDVRDDRADRADGAAEAQDRRRVDAVRGRVTRWAGIAATIWMVCGTLTIAVTYADIAGVPLSQVGGRELVAFVQQFDLGRSLTASTLIAAVISTGCLLATRTTTVGLMAILSVIGVFPLALTGHSAGAANHGAAVDAQFAHVVALSVWIGGLVGVGALQRSYAGRFAALLARFSVMAGWCFAVVAVSGVVGALLRVPNATALLSTYGALLAAKTVCLALLGIAGWYHRRRVVTQLTTGSVAVAIAFRRVLLAEVAVLAIAAGLGVALSRTSPTAAGAESASEGVLGYPIPPPLGAAQWFTQWQLNLLWLVVAVVLAGWYLTAALRLRRRGDHWPVGRALFWLLGCLLLVWTTNGAPGVYGRVLFSLHMVEHMTIAMVVPFLLVLGAPVTLALRTLPVRHDGSRGAREWLLLLVHSRWMRIIGHPVVISIVFIGGTVVFYYTPLFELALRTHTGHVLMTVHFLLSGYVFSWMICGIDPGPSRPVYPLRMIILMVSLAFHAFVGIAMMSSVEVFGREWFAALDRPWGPTLEQDQFRGGALAWALGDYPAALMSTALALRWIQSDHRERRRYDRKAQRDGDAELRAYNERLLQLHHRSNPEEDRT